MITVDETPRQPDAEASPAPAVGDGKFRVRLSNFEGPFDLLLQLISQHELDVTEVALHTVTDDFIAHIRSMGDDWSLDETTEFLVIAATLLDLKAARLLPAAEVEDEDDLALLEARDLLFARLLQYRAYKQVAALFSELEATAMRRYPRSVAAGGPVRAAAARGHARRRPDAFAQIAAVAFRPKPPPTISLAHLHVAKVSVREHAAMLRIRLAESGSATFSELVSDCDHTLAGGRPVPGVAGALPAAEHPVRAARRAGGTDRHLGRWQRRRRARGVRERFGQPGRRRGIPVTETPADLDALLAEAPQEDHPTPEQEPAPAADAAPEPEPAADLGSSPRQSPTSPPPTTRASRSPTCPASTTTPSSPRWKPCCSSSTPPRPRTPSPPRWTCP